MFLCYTGVLAQNTAATLVAVFHLLSSFISFGIIGKIFTAFYNQNNSKKVKGLIISYHSKMKF
jgi:lysine/ornithine N-monooxygenase